MVHPTHKNDYNLAVTVSSGIAYRTRQYLRKLLVFSKKSLPHKIFLKETENKISWWDKRGIKMKALNFGSDSGRAN